MRVSGRLGAVSLRIRLRMSPLSAVTVAPVPLVVVGGLVAAARPDKAPNWNGCPPPGSLPAGPPVVWVMLCPPPPQPASSSASVIAVNADRRNVLFMASVLPLHRLTPGNPV